MYDSSLQSSAWLEDKHKEFSIFQKKKKSMSIWTPHFLHFQLHTGEFMYVVRSGVGRKEDGKIIFLT